MTPPHRKHCGIGNTTEEEEAFSRQLLATNDNESLRLDNYFFSHQQHQDDRSRVKVVPPENGASASLSSCEDWRDGKARSPPSRSEKKMNRNSSSWPTSPGVCSIDQSDDGCFGSTILFPVKLFSMLEDSADSPETREIVSWLEGGKAFKVHNKKDFENIVLPKYFKMTKYKSFTRQLHLYHFKWVKSGPGKGAYAHPNFTRNDPETAHQLSRSSPKKVTSLSCTKTTTIPLTNLTPFVTPASSNFERTSPHQQENNENDTVYSGVGGGQHQHQEAMPHLAPGGDAAKKPNYFMSYDDSPTSLLEPRTLEEMMNNP